MFILVNMPCKTLQFSLCNACTFSRAITVSSILEFHCEMKHYNCALSSLVQHTCVEQLSDGSLYGGSASAYISPFRPNTNCELSGKFTDQLLSDLYESWPALATTIVTSFFFSSIAIAMLRFVSGTVIWGMIMGVFLSFLSGVLLLWIRYERLNSNFSNLHPAEKTAEDRIELLS